MNEFYELPMPNDDSDLVFGTTITYAGTIGGECFMTNTKRRGQSLNSE